MVQKVAVKRHFEAGFWGNFGYCERFRGRVVTAARLWCRKST